MNIGEVCLRSDRIIRYQLGGWGSLVVREPNLLTLEHQGGESFNIPAGDLLQTAPALHYAVSPEEGRVLLVPSNGTAVYRFDAATLKLATIARMRRWLDPNEPGYDPGGLYWVQLHPVEASVLIVYECGALRVDFEDRVFWERTHACFSYYQGLHDNSAWFESNEGERRWGYRLADGTDPTRAGWP